MDKRRFRASFDAWLRQVDEVLSTRDEPTEEPVDHRAVEDEDAA